MAKAEFWNLRAKLVGNLLPLLLGAPFFIYGVILARQTHVLIGKDLIFLAIGVLLPTLFLNWLAMVGNKSIKTSFYARHSRAFHKPDALDSFFCGMAWPEFSSLLDPHQDVGYLTLDKGEVHYFGEQFRFQIEIKDISSIRWKKNPHSFLGLGGFLAITWSDQGKTEVVFLESRNESNLLANKKKTKQFMSKALDQLRLMKPGT